ncbi:MAG TPA: PIN domain-containing protein [Candidatus Norongarragalinales archaeon]|nr:PIN domain-containing protein [Candidatus Norongarragalinales archaeon]
MSRLFLDTSFLVHLLTEKHAEARTLYDSGETKLTNEYVVKELRRVLLKRRYFESDISDFISEIRKRCRVLATPSKDRYGRITLRNKSDVPIVLGAKDVDAVLLTFHHVLAQDAKKYVHAVCLE